MDKYTIAVGNKVHFRRKVFEGSYVPYFNEYAGHKFEVVAFHPGDHVELKCVDGDVKVKGYVHLDEIRNYR